MAVACRSSLRLSLKDQPAIVARAKTTAAQGNGEAQKALLDAGRCFSPAVFADLLRTILDRGETIAYAAEAAARVAAPALAPPLLDLFDKRKKTCKTKEADADVCVWLTYAPGALLEGADRALRQRAAEAAAFMLDAPNPKMREVAVETLAAAKLEAFAEPLEQMIEKEQKKQLQEPNAPALIVRFRQHLKAIKKGD